MSDNYFKIAVVGGGGVGKSCLTIRFLRDMFIEKYDPTIEESYRKDVMVDEQAVTLEILDTAGQEEYTSIRDRYLRKQDGFACVFSLTSKATVGEVKRAFLHIRRVKDEDDIVGVLIANKCDISEEERAVSSDVGKDLAREFNVPYVECSAKTGENVHDSFYTIVREIRKARKNNIVLFRNHDSESEINQEMLFFTQTDLQTMEFDLETKKQIIAQAQSNPDNLKDKKEKEKLEALVSKYEKDKVNYQIKKEIVQDEGKIDIVLSWAGIISGMSERNRYNYELQFSLRAIHKYLPWINKIYILINSDTKPPYWLKENYPNSKIVIVDRCTLIANPAHCPTYNTFAIYTVVHKIPGLANKFILMDDDFFFNRPVGPEYMFTPMGLPIVYQDYEKTTTYGNTDPLLPEIRSKGYPRWKYAPWTHIPMPMRRDYIIKFDENYPGYLELVQSHYEKRYRQLTEEVSMTYYLFFKNKGWIKTPGRQKAMFFQTPKFHKNDITQEFENYYNIIVNRKKIAFNVNDSFSTKKDVYKKQRKVLWDFYMKLYPETPDYELPNPNHKKYS